MSAGRILRLCLVPFAVVFLLLLGLVEEYLALLLLGAAFLWIPATIILVNLGLGYPFNLVYWAATAALAAVIASRLLPWLTQFGSPPEAAQRLAAGLPVGPLPPPGKLEACYSFAYAGVAPGSELAFMLQPGGPPLATGEVVADFVLRFEGQLTTLETATLACLLRQGIRRRHCLGSSYWFHQGRSLKALYDEKWSFDWF